MGAAEALSAEEAQEAHAELDAQALQVAALEWLLETCGVNRSKVRRPGVRILPRHSPYCADL